MPTSESGRSSCGDLPSRSLARIASARRVTGCSNSKLLSAFDLSEPSLRRYAGTVKASRPQKLFGYASALALLAGFLGRSGWQAPREWPRVVFTTAEPLYDYQRTLIESVFTCPAAVEYGARDAGLVANESPSGSLHIAAEGILVEVGDGGELLVTNLESFAMPIIRYRTGDVGSLDDKLCSCGRGLPLLRSVEGRRTDFLVTAEGKLLHALAAIYVLRELPAVREFQMSQERSAHVTVSVVPDSVLDAATQDIIVTQFRRLLGPRAEVEVRVTESIPRPSGKHRYVISHAAEEQIGLLLAR